MITTNSKLTSAWRELLRQHYTTRLFSNSEKVKSAFLEPELLKKMLTGVRTLKGTLPIIDMASLITDAGVDLLLYRYIDFSQHVATVAALYVITHKLS